jgi:hypothetical protein
VGDDERKGTRLPVGSEDIMQYQNSLLQRHIFEPQNAIQFTMRRLLTSCRVRLAALFHCHFGDIVNFIFIQLSFHFYGQVSQEAALISPLNVQYCLISVSA